ncbi:unnamed protein product [Phaeothamnion confervicola]
MTRKRPKIGPKPRKGEDEADIENHVPINCTDCRRVAPGPDDSDDEERDDCETTPAPLAEGIYPVVALPNDNVPQLEKEEREAKRSWRRRCMACCCCRVLWHRSRHVRWGSRLLLLVFLGLLAYYFYVVVDILSVRTCLESDATCVDNVTLSVADVCGGAGMLGVGLAASINWPTRQRVDVSAVQFQLSYDSAVFAVAYGDTVFDTDSDTVRAAVMTAAATGATSAAAADLDDAKTTLTLSHDLQEMSAAAALNFTDVKTAASALGRALSGKDVGISFSAEARIRTGAFLVPVSIRHSFHGDVSCGCVGGEVMGQTAAQCTYLCQYGGFPIVSSGGSSDGSGTESASGGSSGSSSSISIALDSVDVRSGDDGNSTSGAGASLLILPNVTAMLTDPSFTLNLPALALGAWYSQSPQVDGDNSAAAELVAARPPLATARLPALSVGAGRNALPLVLAVRGGASELADLRQLVRRAWDGDSYSLYLAGAGATTAALTSASASAAASAAASASESDVSVACVSQRLLDLMPAVRWESGSNGSLSSSSSDGGSISSGNGGGGGGSGSAALSYTTTQGSDGGSGGSFDIGSAVDGLQLKSADIFRVATEGAPPALLGATVASNQLAGALAASALLRLSMAELSVAVSFDLNFPGLNVTVTAAASDGSGGDGGEILGVGGLFLPGGRYSADHSTDLLLAPSVRLVDPATAVPKLVNAAAGNGIVATVGNGDGSGGSENTVIGTIVGAVLDAGVTVSIGGSSSSGGGSSGGSGDLGGDSNGTAVASINSGSSDSGNGGGWFKSLRVIATSNVSETSITLSAVVAPLSDSSGGTSPLKWRDAAFAVPMIVAVMKRDDDGGDFSSSSSGRIGQLVLTAARFVPAEGGAVIFTIQAAAEDADLLKEAIDDFFGVNSGGYTKEMAGSAPLLLSAAGNALLDDWDADAKAALAATGASGGIDLSALVGRQNGASTESSSGSGGGETVGGGSDGSGGGGGLGGTSSLTDAVDWLAIVGGDAVGTDIVLPCPLRDYCPSPPPAAATAVTLAAGVRVALPDSLGGSLGSNFTVDIPPLTFAVRSGNDLTPLALVALTATRLRGEAAGKNGTDATGNSLASLNVTDMDLTMTATDALNAGEAVEFRAAPDGEDVLARVLASVLEFSLNVSSSSFGGSAGNGRTSGGGGGGSSSDSGIGTRGGRGDSVGLDFYYPTACEGTWTLMETTATTADFQVVLPTVSLPAPLTLANLAFDGRFEGAVIMNGSAAAADGTLVLDGGSDGGSGSASSSAGKEAPAVILEIRPAAAAAGEAVEAACGYPWLDGTGFCPLATLVHDALSAGGDGPVDVGLFLAFDRRAVGVGGFGPGIGSSSDGGNSGGSSGGGDDGGAESWGGRQNMELSLRLYQMQLPEESTSSEYEVPRDPEGGGGGGGGNSTAPSCTDLTVLDSFAVKIGDSVLSSIDIWNGIDVTISVVVRNPFNFEIVLGAIRVTLTINDPDGADVLLLPSVGPDPDYLIAANWTADLGDTILAAGETRMLSDLTLKIPTEGAAELVARVYDEASLKGRLCGSATDGFMEVRLQAAAATVEGSETDPAVSKMDPLVLQLPFDFRNLSLVGTASCELFDAGACEPEWADDFAYDGSFPEGDFVAVADANIGDMDWRVVDDKSGETGAVWRAAPWQLGAYNDDWELELKFELGPDGPFGPADGLALVLQAEGTGVVGGGGGYELGYSGIGPNSLALAMNVGLYNEAMIWTGGVTTSNPSTDALAYVGNDYTGNGGLKFDNNDSQNIRMRYSREGNVLRVYYRDDPVPIMAAGVDMSELFPDGSAYVGVTASTPGGFGQYTRVTVQGIWGRRPLTSAAQSRIEEDGGEVAGSFGESVGGTETAAAAMVVIDARDTCRLPRYGGGATWTALAAPVDDAGAVGDAAAANVTDLETGRYEVSFLVPAAGLYEISGCIAPCDDGAVALGRVTVLLE